MDENYLAVLFFDVHCSDKEKCISTKHYGNKDFWNKAVFGAIKWFSHIKKTRDTSEDCEPGPYCKHYEGQQERVFDNNCFHSFIF